MAKDDEQKCKNLCYKVVLLDKTTLIYLSCGRKKHHDGPHAQQLAQTKSTVCWPIFGFFTASYFTIKETYKDDDIVYYKIISDNWPHACDAWAADTHSAALSWHCKSEYPHLDPNTDHTGHDWLYDPPALSSSTELVMDYELSTDADAYTPTEYYFASAAKKKEKTLPHCNGPGAKQGPNGLPGSGSGDYFNCELEDKHGGCHVWWSSQHGAIAWPPLNVCYTLVAFDEDCNYRLYKDDFQSHTYYLTYYSTQTEETQWWYCTTPHGTETDNAKWTEHVWTSAAHIAKATKESSAKKKKKASKEKAKPALPETLILLAARHRRVVGGRKYSVAVKWIAHYSVTNQEGQYAPITARIRSQLVVGPYKTEWGAIRSAQQHVDKFSRKEKVIRFERVEPLLPPELREDERR